jgi:acyl-CoA thioester hydrolase
VTGSATVPDVFSFPVRVYWEDTDAGGVVYYANYLRFLERARTEWLRARGYSQQSLSTEQGIQFMVLGVGIEYRAPARLDDLLRVTCEPHVESRTTARFVQHIYRDSPTPGLLVEASVRVVCVDSHTLRPRRLAGYLS